MSNHKNSSNKHLLKRTVLGLVTLLLILAVGLYTYNYYSVEQDRRVFLGFSEDMKNLQTEFNKVQNGWTYDEYCEGVGSTIDKNSHIACTIELKNPNDAQPQENHDKYVKIIEDSQVFETIRLREPVFYDNEYIVSTFAPISIPSGKCRLTTLDYLEDDEQGSALYCIATDVKGFHYRYVY